jgi:tetratricopeptide (TPR) repeat protein
MSGKQCLFIALLVFWLTRISFCDLNQTKDSIIELINQGQTEEAAKAVDKIISENSQDSFLPVSLYWIAWTYGWNNKIDEEKNLYQTIINDYQDTSIIESSKLGYESAKVRELINKQQFGEANEILEKLISNFSNNQDLPGTIYHIGLRYEWADRNDEAQKIYQHLRGNFPESQYGIKAKLNFERAKINSYISSGKIILAKEAFGKMISDFNDDTNLPDTLINIAQRFGLSNLYEQEGKISKYIIENFPNDRNVSAAKYNYSKSQVHSLVALHRFEDANAMLDKFISDFNERSDLPDALYWIARRYEWNDRYAKAAEIFKAILERTPNKINLDKALIGIKRVNICSQILSGKMENTSADISNLVTGFIDNPELPDTLNNIARRYEWEFKYDESRDIYQKIIDKWPESKFDQKAKIGLSSLKILELIDSNSYDEVDSEIERFTADYNNNPYLYESLLFIANKAYDKGYEARAKNEAYGKFINLSAKILDEKVLNKIEGMENQTQAYYLASVANYRLGKVDKTMEYADKVLQIAPEFIHAASMQWLIADGYEKLEASGAIPKAEADLIIEEEYKKLIDNYNNGMDSMGALRLGEIYIEQGRMTEACACLGWYLMRMGIDECSAAQINGIFKKCERCKK